MFVLAEFVSSPRCVQTLSSSLVLTVERVWYVPFCDLKWQFGSLKVAMTSFRDYLCKIDDCLQLLEHHAVVSFELLSTLFELVSQES